ncbi:MAG: DNA replication and repair protein RecF [Polyangiaceae bacterium]
MSDTASDRQSRIVSVERLSLRQIRNLKPITLQFSAGLNVLTGDNGQGKTSILEAIVLGLTSRSFRTEQTKDVVAHGHVEALVDLAIAEAGGMREQRVVFAQNRKNTLIDGKRVARISDFASRTPVVIFHPADLELVSGPASLRRTLLDRVAFYLLPMTLESRRAYQLALRERQRLLTERGPKADGLDAFEAVASEHGAVLSSAHAEAAAKLLAALGPIAESLAPPGLIFEGQYVPGGTSDRETFARTLKEGRNVDLFRGRAGFGPQRDELALLLGNKDARKHASQGQQRLFALALKLAEFESILQARQQYPVLLLDDVASELDPHRTSAVIDWVSRIQSQVFVTTTRWSDANEGLFPTLPRRKFWLHDGVAEQEP